MNVLNVPQDGLGAIAFRPSLHAAGFFLMVNSHTIPPTVQAKTLRIFFIGAPCPVLYKMYSYSSHFNCLSSQPHSLSFGHHCCLLTGLLAPPQHIRCALVGSQIVLFLCSKPSSGFLSLSKSRPSPTVTSRSPTVWPRLPSSPSSPTPS